MPADQTRANPDPIEELYRQFPPPHGCSWRPMPDGSVVLACGPRTTYDTTIAIVPDEVS